MAILTPEPPKTQLSTRFRGYYPVIVDVETAGFNPLTDALLEIAAITTTLDESGALVAHETYHFHVLPFPNANLNPEALAFTGIEPFSPLRNAVEERTAIIETFRGIRRAVSAHGCKRAILVGHNAHFDHSFLKSVVERNQIKRDPFHPFSTLDTVSLSAILLGHTVLARACKLAHIEFDTKEAHSALYDAKKTAELFFYLVNQSTQLCDQAED